LVCFLYQQRPDTANEFQSVGDGDGPESAGSAVRATPRLWMIAATVPGIAIRYPEIRRAGTRAFVARSLLASAGRAEPVPFQTP
jgi:hypothetical protein